MVRKARQNKDFIYKNTAVIDEPQRYFFAFNSID